VTSEAQGISEQDRADRIAKAAIDLSRATAMTPAEALGLLKAASGIATVEAERDAAMAALADRDRELAELRAKIAEIQRLVDDSGPRRMSDGEMSYFVLSREDVKAALASSGSAPTGQEER
jgi:hypothetical protein